MLGMTGSTNAPNEPGPGDSIWSGVGRAKRLRALADRLAGDVVLSHAAGRRLLDVGHGAPEITRWVTPRAASVTTVERSDLLHSGEPKLGVPDASVDLVFCLRTLPHLGTDADESTAQAMKTLEEIGRALVPAGTALVQIENPRSLAGLYHGLRDPLAHHVVAHTGSELTRFDSVPQFLRLLPRTLEFVRVHGLGALMALWGGVRVPLLSRALERAEWIARDDAVLRYFGRQMLIELRRTRPAGGTLGGGPAARMRGGVR